jgi:3'-phosphoadenosine 5'-phosphosulfate sulfotransferase (PAPS reductase)/FAD synthetase
MPAPRTIIVPVSGGKDSQVVLSLALKKYSRARVVCVHQNTGFDHPLTYKQLKAMEKFYGVPVEHTKSKFGGMLPFLRSAGYFPNSAARGCTQRLKQEPFAAWLKARGFNKENCEIWFGMRSDESQARNKKYGGLRSSDRFTLSDISPFYGAGSRRALGAIPVRLPIVHYTTARVFRHIAEEGAPLNALYAKGHVRVGCYPCLLARKSEWAAAGKDRTGQKHIGEMLALQEEWRAEGNPRKFIKVHRVWDVREFLPGGQGAEALPDADEQCGYCSI